MKQELPLVVLHGWMHDAASWQSFKNKFHTRQVYTIDLPGFGNEPLVSPTWGIEDYADWVEKKIHKTVTGPFILLGHSFGGRIASVLASRHMKGLDTLILYGAPLLYRPTLKVKCIRFFARLLKSIVPSGIKRRLLVNEELSAADASGRGDVFRKAVSFDQTELLPRISACTFMVWGSQDREAPVHLARLAQTLIPSASLEILQGVGHNAHLEKPDLFYGTITRFLETV